MNSNFYALNYFEIIKHLRNYFIRTKLNRFLQNTALVATKSVIYIAS